ncbi:MAG: YlxR family protein [Candidatus Gastranaerophilales bacterium]|nr:YlxR family protein [Candidatus Gastranaerophilales bacterium]
MNRKQQQKNNPKEGEDNNLSPSLLKAEKLRKCIACGEFFDRKKMIRLLKNHTNNQIVINPDNKTFGRSAYLCKNEDCLKTAIKKSRFQKALRGKVDENTIEKLKIMIN